MDDNVRALRHLRYQAEHDPVTGYSNFAKFKTDAAELLAARGDRKYSLWYCDIRNFKFINDIYGYDIGESCSATGPSSSRKARARERRSGVFPATTLPCCGAIGISTIWWRGSCAVRIC
ncbi:MAG: GGDEF domain-containing protein [Bilophila wadsworthia]